MITSTSARARQGRAVPPRSRTWAFTAICLGFFAVILDTTIVNVALPAIGAGFGTGITSLQWVVNGYNIVFAALLLTCGALADRRGGKRAFGYGVGIFVAGSLICGLAPAFPALVAGRVIQGLGAALLMPASLTLIAHTYPEPAARTRAVAAWAACAGAATAIGPVLGGILVDFAGWRAIFLVNLPIGAIAVALLARHATETASTPRGIDLPGQILGIIALAAIAFGLTEAGPYGWSSPVVIGLLAAGLLAVALLAVAERAAPSPLLPPRLLAHRSFSAANAVGLLLNFGIYGQVFVLSLYFQQLRHFSALATGMMLLPFAGVTVVGPPVTGRLTARFGPRAVMIAGQIMAAAGTAILALAGPHTSYLMLVPGLFLLGMGFAATMPSLTAAVMLAAPKQYAGIASGVLNASRQVGGVLGIALLGTLISGRAHFTAGLHVALIIVTAAFVTGIGLAALCARRPRAASLPADARGPSREAPEAIAS